MNYPQLSDWRGEAQSISQQRPSLIQFSNDREDNSGEEDAIRNRGGFCLYSACVRGLVIGVLLGGIALAVVLILWLKAPPVPNKIATSTNTEILATTTSTTTSTSTSSTSTTTTSSTSTTPTPPCAPKSVGSSSSLYTATSGASSYACQAFAWTALTTGSVTLAFQLRNDPDYWYVDDVSVYNSAVQMLSNGGFETDSLSPWVRTTPNGVCTGVPGQASPLSPHTGTYSLIDGSYGCADQIGQSFVGTAGQVYVVSFWIKSGSNGTGISASVTLS